MSIYATWWTLKFPKDGDDTPGCEWIKVRAQAVPAHIGSPTPGCGYEDGDPYASFLPPAIEVDLERERDLELPPPCPRAVVFVTENTAKGTARSAQEYQNPLLVLTGDEYLQITFNELHQRICEALRQNHAAASGEW